jgi:hypothetical protein
MVLSVFHKDICLMISSRIQWKLRLTFRCLSSSDWLHFFFGTLLHGIVAEIWELKSWQTTVKSWQFDNKKIVRHMNYWHLFRQDVSYWFSIVHVTPWNLVLQKLIIAQLVKVCLTFVETEGPLSCLGDPATVLYIETRIHSVTLRQILYYPTVYALFSQVVSSLDIFRLKFYKHFRSFQCVLYVPPITAVFILSP